MPNSIQITETSPLLHDANCVYCHVDLELGDHAVVCESCHSPHHADCWQANNSHCAIFGCSDADATASTDELHAVQQEDEVETLEEAVSSLARFILFMVFTLMAILMATLITIIITSIW